MKKIVLHQENIETILESLLNENDKDSQKILEEYRSFDGELSIINYLLLTVKDHLVKKGYSEEDIIKKIFSLDSDVWMSFFTCDSGFIDFLMQRTKNNTISVSDELPCLVESFHNHEYSPKIHP